MRLNLGKWLLVLLIAWSLFADVSVKVDKKEVIKGDTVTFTITAQGEDVAFPIIKEIEGFPILGTAQRSHILMSNGHVTKRMSKSYTFAPMRDVTIPSFSLKVDGQTFTTDPIKIHLTHRSSSTEGGADDPMIQIALPKRELYVGEPVTLTLTLRYPAGENIVQANIPPLQFDHFWIKPIGQMQRHIEDHQVVEVRHYLLFAQKAGRHRLGPVIAQILKRVRTKPPINDPFFNDDFFSGFFARLQKSRIASNSIDIKVKPLPGGVELYGHFDLSTKVDKTVVQPNKPVILTLHIKGEGNIEDVPKFEPNLPGAIVYAEEPKIEDKIVQGSYQGDATQTITFVANSDFTIPSFTIRYYDPKLKKVVEKKSDPIAIHVVGTQPSAAIQKPLANPSKVDHIASPHPLLQNQKNRASANSFMAHPWRMAPLFILFGVLLGSAGVLLWQRIKARTKGATASFSSDLPRQILRAKTDRELLDLLLPYAKTNKTIEEVVEKLEANLYEGTRHRFDKKMLAAMVAQLEEIKKESRLQRYA